MRNGVLTATIRVAALAVLIAATQASCGVGKKVRRTVEDIFEATDRIERLAHGDTTQIVPLAALALGGQDYCDVVHREDRALVVEVKRIPGLGLKVPRLDDRRYYVRIDFTPEAGATRLLIAFFRSAKGVYVVKEAADDIVSQGAAKLFGAILEALLKSGVVFK